MVASYLLHPAPRSAILPLQEHYGVLGTSKRRSMTGLQSQLTEFVRRNSRVWLEQVRLKAAANPPNDRGRSHETYDECGNLFFNNLNPENDGAKENSKIVKSKGSELAYGLSTTTPPRMPVCIYDGKGLIK